MKRYINANTLIQDIEKSRANNEHNNAIASQTHNAEHRHFIKMVLDQPTADVIENAPDVVEVVRCKDCKHGRPIDKTKSPENNLINIITLRYIIKNYFQVFFTIYCSIFSFFTNKKYSAGIK